MLSGATAAATWMLKLWVDTCLVEEESATWTVKANVFACVEVPLMVPEVLSVKPGGREPDTILHEYGEVPPVADRVAL